MKNEGKRKKKKKKEFDEGPTWRMVDGGFDTSFETRIRGGGGKNNIEEKAELGKNGVEK